MRTQQYSSLLTRISATGRAGMNICFGSALGGVRVLAQTGQAGSFSGFPIHYYLKSFEASLSMLSYPFCIVL